MKNSAFNKSMDQNRKCAAKNGNGAPCDAFAQRNSQFCFFHDPEKAILRRAAQRAGGMERSRPAATFPPESPDQSLKTPSDVLDLMEVMINRLLRGELDPRIANSVGYLSVQTLKAIEQVNLERRIAALEALAEKEATKSNK